MGEYNKYKKVEDKGRESYDRNRRFRGSSIHLYVAYKDDEYAGKKEERENCEGEVNIGAAFEIKSWSLEKFRGITVESQLEKQFNELSNRWKDETGAYSTTFQKIINDLYFDVVALGKDVIPFILKDLQNNGPAHWHTALKALSKQNPVPSELMSKNRLVKEYWIKWGKDNHLI